MKLSHQPEVQESKKKLLDYGEFLCHSRRVFGEKQVCSIVHLITECNVLFFWSFWLFFSVYLE